MGSNNSDDDVLLKLNLDDEGFQQTLLKAKQSLGNLGKNEGGEEGIKGLVDKFSNLKGTIGDIAEGGSLKELVAGFSELGSTLAGPGIVAGMAAIGGYLAVEGEKVQAVSKEFDLLARNAGIAGDQIKEQFLAATGGIISDTEALELANKAMLKLGSSADKMPELMELARKSAMVMGKDVGEQFENITRAVMSGNKRMLQRVGITVDVAKATRAYAESLGVAEDSLSQAGKEQAIINAALADGKEKFKGVSESITPISTAWKQFKVQLVELGEVVQTWANRWFGPSMEFVVNAMTYATRALKLFSKTAMDVFTGHWNESSKSFDKMAVSMKHWREEAEKPVNPGGTNDRAKAEAVDDEKIKANRAKFYKEIAAMDAKAAKDEIELAQREVQLKKGENDYKLAMEKQYQGQIQAIQMAKYLDEKQKGVELQKLHNEHEREKERFEDGSLKRREKMLDNYQKHSTGVFNAIGRSAKKASDQAAIDMKTGAKQGEVAFTELKGMGVDAFQAIGRGAAGGSMDMEKAVLSSLGRIASNYGEAMMLSAFAFGKFNAAEFAAGAALEVLAGALGQVASGTSASTGGGSSSAGYSSGGGAGSSSATSSSSSISSINQTQKSSVVINVQGSVFDTPATGMRMVDLIRQASDQTDYAYVQIGNKPYGA